MGTDGEMSLQLFIGGMRGSRPALGSGFDEFGGDTTSLLLIGSRGERLVLDAGTGMHAVAGVCSVPVRASRSTGILPVIQNHGRDGVPNAVFRVGEPHAHATETPDGVAANEVTMLFSHYHLDHMAGLTMNPLFYRRDWSFRFLGPTFADGGVRDAVTRLLAQPYWPVSWKQMQARMEFAEFPGDGIEIGCLQVRACPVPHPAAAWLSRRRQRLRHIPGLRHRPRMATANALAGGGLHGAVPPAETASLLIIDAHFARKTRRPSSAGGTAAARTPSHAKAAASNGRSSGTMPRKRTTRRCVLWNRGQGTLARRHARAARTVVDGW